MKLFVNIEKKYILITLVLLAATIPSIVALLHSGFFVTDDGDWMVIRFSAFYQTLRDGQFPPRFLERLNHGYGYPVANFLYPGFMYMALIFKVVGFNVVDSVKLVLITSLILSAVGAFLWLKNHFTTMPSLIGSLFYLYFPYHLYDVYTRGSVGEVVGLGIMPFLLYTVDKGNVLLSSILYACLILSHNTLALLFSPILFLYIFFQRRRMFFAIPIGLLLSCFFWFPALFETQYTVFSNTTVSNWQDYLIGGNSLGLIGSLGLLLCFYAFLLLFKKQKPTVLFFAIIFLASILLSTYISIDIWRFNLFTKIVQFPFRFLLLAVVSGSFLVSFLVSTLCKKYGTIIYVIVLAFLFFDTLSYIWPKEFTYRDIGYYTTNEDTTTVKNEYMPKWATQPLTDHASSETIILSGTPTISKTFHAKQTTSFTVDSPTESFVGLSRVYYPGWTATIDGMNVDIDPVNEKGLVAAHVPSGNHTVAFTFGETPVRLATDIISSITLVGIGILYLGTILKRNYGKK